MDNRKLIADEIDSAYETLSNTLDFINLLYNQLCLFNKETIESFPSARAWLKHVMTSLMGDNFESIELKYPSLAMMVINASSNNDANERLISAVYSYRQYDSYLKDCKYRLTSPDRIDSVCEYLSNIIYNLAAFAVLQFNTFDNSILLMSVDKLCDKEGITVDQLNDKLCNFVTVYGGGFYLYEKASINHDKFDALLPEKMDEIENENLSVTDEMVAPLIAGDICTGDFLKLYKSVKATGDAAGKELSSDVTPKSLVSAMDIFGGGNN